MKGHALVLTDRGRVHRHRWSIGCQCGWVGVHRRRRKEAVTQHHIHIDTLKGYTRRGAHPQPLTPYDQLPEALR